MGNIAVTLVLVLVVLVFIAEFYKGSFERQMESKDERGQILIFKVKSLSYKILSFGILIGVVVVAIFKLMDKEYFIYYVMIVFFIQSIASSVYLAVVRKA